MNRLRLIRREKDLSGVDVAARLGITPQHYYDLERGRRDITDKLAEKIAAIYDISEDYLLGKSDERHGAPKHIVYAGQIEQLEELARKHGYRLSDPAFVQLISKALDFISIVKKEGDA